MIKPCVSVLSAKGRISIQDLGRQSALQFGFSASGAADEFSFLSNNLALQNNLNDAVIEVAFGQLCFTVNINTHFMVTGAQCMLTINDKEVKHWQVHAVNIGDSVKLSAPKQGVYSYIGFKGGIQTPQYFNSRCELPEKIIAAESNLSQQLLNKKTIHLPLKKTSLPPEHIKNNVPSVTATQIQTWQKNYQTNTLVLRFIPQQPWQTLPLKRQAKLAKQPFKLSTKSNKMGYRLQGDAIKLSHTPLVMLSKPVCYGCIQIPEDGQPIVLMKDHQTIGGYPVLGYVIKTDLFRLAQMRPNSTLSFQPISYQQAHSQLTSFYQRFSHTNELS